MQAASSEDEWIPASWARDRRSAWIAIAVLCGVYVASFAAFYPRLPVVDDERRYIAQSRLLLEGTSSEVFTDARTGDRIEKKISDYPIGTAALLTPLVAIAGWRGAFVIPVLCLIGGVWITGRWIQGTGRSPLFALLLLGFFPAQVMGRVAMSDIPSTAWAALTLWLFWLGMKGGAWPWFLSGLLAGASSALRPPNVLLFAPLFAGTVLRWDRNWWWIALGGLIGSGLRLYSSFFVFGDPLAARTTYVFEPETIMDRLPLYLLGLVVLIPGGLIFGVLYRGERRPEVVTTFVFVFAFFLFQTYSTIETGPEKRLILGLRYFIPLVPLICFAMAEAVPRLWGELERRLQAPQRRRLRDVGRFGFYAWLAGIGIACVGVQGYLQWWSSAQAEIAEALREHVAGDAVLVSNLAGTQKFLHGLELEYAPIKRDHIEPAELSGLVERHGSVTVAFLDRTDSVWWRGQTELNASFVAALGPGPELLVDRSPTDTDRIRIWRVEGSGP